VALRQEGSSLHSKGMVGAATSGGLMVNVAVKFRDRKKKKNKRIDD